MKTLFPTKLRVSNFASYRLTDNHKLLKVLKTYVYCNLNQQNLSSTFQFSTSTLVDSSYSKNSKARNKLNEESEYKQL